MTLDDIKARCVITDDGHWIWKGAMSEGKFPRIWAPDYTRGGHKTGQHGRRAVWHLKTGMPIPEGWRVWSTCDCAACLNPDHIACGTSAAWGAHMARIGKHKTMVHRVASRRAAQARMVLSPDQIGMVQSDPRTGRELARALGVSEQTISRARTGRIVCHLPLASPFSGLGAR